MDPKEIDLALDELETRLDRLRSLYEQYFLGIEKIEPQVARKDVDRRFWLLRRVQIRNTARRFRMQVLIQRYNTFQQHWARICREIENGTYVRHLLKAKKNLGAEPKTWAAKRRMGLLRRGAEGEEGASGEGGAADPNAQPDSFAPGGALGAHDPFAAIERAAPEDLFDDDDAETRRPPAPAAKPEPVRVAPLRSLDSLDLLELDFEEAPPARSPAPRAPQAQPPKAPSVRPPRPASYRPPPPPQLRTAPSSPPLPVRPPSAQPVRPAVQPPAASSGPRPVASQGPRPAVAPTVARPAAGAMGASPRSPASTVPHPGAAPTPGQAPRTTPAAPRPNATPSTGAPGGVRPPAPVPPNGNVARPAAAPNGPGVVRSPAASPSATSGATRAPAGPAAPKPAAPRPAAPAAPAVASAKPGGLSDERVRQLHAELVATKQKLNQPNNISVDSLAKSLRETESKLRAQHQGRSVDFTVVLKDGKPVVKPVVRK